MVRAAMRTTRKSLGPSRRGFTLLEVLLALGLSIVVITAVSYAIFFHLRVLDSQRNRVEQSLVARGMLNMMANDIRAAVQYKEVDVSQLDSLLSSVDLTSLLASPGAADLLGSTGGVSMDALMGDDTGLDAETEATAGEEGPRPGLYGSANELLVDISRMPRRDQYLNGLQTVADDYASDFRTVSYRLVPTQALPPEIQQQSGSIVQSTGLGASTGDSLSLVRSTASQAWIRYAEQSGQMSEYFGNTEVLANEVTQLQFRYFDGAAQSWVESWDTDEMASLPTAVEIRLQLQFHEPNFNNASSMSATGTTGMTQDYRVVVHLPLAEPADESDEAASGSSSGAVGASTSAGASANGGGAP